MTISNQEIDQVIMYVKQNYREILAKEPEQVAEEIMDAVKAYGNLAKLYLRTNWNTIKHYLLNPRITMEELRKRDPELYHELMKHPRWLNRFFKKMYQELKTFMQT